MRKKVVTIGSAVKDIFLFLKEDDWLPLKNPRHEIDRRRLIGLEYGAKIEVDRSRVTIGGGAANSATTFSRLGFGTAVLAAIGADADGAAIVEGLGKDKIATRFIRRVKGKPTAFSVIIVPEAEGSSDHVVLVERGASVDLPMNLSKTGKADCLYVTALAGNWRSGLDKITRHVKSKKLNWVWNPGAEQIESGLGGLGRFIKHCSIFMVNRDEALSLAGHDKKSEPSDDPAYLLSSIMSWGPAMAIITDGQKGVYYADRNNKFFMSANQDIVGVECTGAGDAFGSGFVSGLLMTNWQNVPLALDLGISNAESVIGKIGSREGILKAADLAKVLGKRGHILKKIHPSPFHGVNKAWKGEG